MTEMAEEVNVEDKIFQAYLDDENLFREEAELMAEDPDEIKSLLKQVRETTGRLRQIAVEYLIRIPDTSPMYRVIW